MKFVQTYDVRFSEADRFDRVTPVALYNFFQETAIRHSESIHQTPDALTRKGYAWVLNRILIEFDRYPLRRDGLSVTTWASTLTGLYAIREWTAEDPGGRPCARATSRWVLVDTNKGRAVKLPPFMAEDYGVIDARAIDYGFPRVSPVECRDHEKRFHVRASDLDANHHANSACYVDWCLEAVPHEVLDGFSPSSVELAYKNESVLGDELTVTSTEEPATGDGTRRFHHALRLLKDGSLLTIGKSVWRPNTRDATE